MKHWWKILGVLLIIYSFVMGMLTPLRTGITEVSPSSASSGEKVTLDVRGYNSYYFMAKEEMGAWLKLDSVHILEAVKIEVEDNRYLKAEFDLPVELPSDRDVQDATLILDHPTDGASVYPAAVFIKKSELPDSLITEKTTWPETELSGLHEKDSIVFPFRNILYETIRNLYYHVPLWFAMFILFIASVFQSAKFLMKGDHEHDQKAAALTSVGVLYGILGLVTGAIWAKHTWGAYWSFDIKQNMTAVGMLIYGAYFVLRSSFEDPEKRARISAVYNIFAFSALIPLLYVIPKMADSLHPGAGGNIALGSEDLDNTMRMVFYPAIIGWTLFGVWVAWLNYRMTRIEEKLLEG